ncbi:MAG: phosphoenolpyruvate carboxykinase (ATP) [Verrucomicrobia subdivision 3 bacterium]|nr:phosphoenolpyruvate carboxykinase (ATP) [Limisphaerales bacterium]
MNTNSLQQIDLKPYGITVKTVLRNLSPAQLYEEAIRREPGSSIAESGALVAYSGAKTGRSPQDKRVVRHPESEKDVWWGAVNIPMEEHGFRINRERAIDYLNTCERLYVVDAFAGWHPQHRLKIRIICSRPYHALFMQTMLIRPIREALATFGEPDYVIFNAGRFPANRLTAGMTSKTSVDLSFEERQMVILGTEYAGEMKKGVFTIMNYLMPKRGLLSMHCSATADIHSESSSVLFGLSGTGKTTLSADPKRRLIGDDEHVWGEDGIFNIEGGCYAKAIDLTPENEPDIFHALRFGSVLENVVFDDEGHHVNFHDTSITQNTRGAYPIEFIKNAKLPCIASHPSDIIFLTCDAFGVLPPVSKLTPEQAMYHFISGYTARVAGTEMGVTEPAATFSACFGAPFLVWHPAKYAELLAEKMKQHKVNVWLINTGWSGGSHGVGARIKLKYTRAIIDAIHAGTLASAPTHPDPIFGLHVVTQVPHVPAGILVPENTWADKETFAATAHKLAGLFIANFKKFESGVTPQVKAAGPKA